MLWDVSTRLPRLGRTRLLTVCFIGLGHIQLAEPKIAKCNVTCVVQQDILRLEVPIHNIERVQVFQCTQELGCVEA